MIEEPEKFSNTSIILEKTYWPSLEYNRRVWFKTKTNPQKIYSYLTNTGNYVTKTDNKPAIMVHTQYKKEGDKIFTFLYENILELRVEPTAVEHKILALFKKFSKSKTKSN